MKWYFVFALFFSLPLISPALAAETVDLAWEADSYAPVLYPGHSRAVIGSRVRVVALAQLNDDRGRALDPRALIYDWTKDGKLLPSVSGQGQNIILYSTGFDSDTSIIGVTVKRSQNDPGLSTTMTIPVAAPEIILYEEDSLLGPDYTKALGTDYNLNKPEVNIRAEPYYFSRGAVSQKQVQFDWTLNGQKIVADPADQSIISFVAPEEGGGQNTVTVSAKNLGQALQTATTKILIEFNWGGNLFNFLPALIKSAYAQNRPGQVQLISNAELPRIQGVDSINDYFRATLSNVLTVLIILTIIAVAWYGLGYLYSNIPGFKSFAKVRIWEIIFGLLVILGAYLILRTINPDILKPNFDPNRVNQDYPWAAKWWR